MRLLRLASASLCAALFFGATARAATPPSGPPADSAISQYVETVPSSGGGAAVGLGISRATDLSQRALDRIVARGGRDAGLLQQIATSSYYGAPSKPLRESGRTHNGWPIDLRLWVILALVTLTALAARFGRAATPRSQPPAATR